MTKSKELTMAVPRIESLHVKNYRALHDLELNNITPLTVFLGPNGSGKSTVFDVFAFLSECFTIGLRKAWDKRGRFKELRTRGCDGPIVIELKYREKPKDPIITYHISIDEVKSGPIVLEEWLKWRRHGRHGQPYKFLEFNVGKGYAISGDVPDDKSERIEETLDSPEMLAVNTLGQFTKHPRVSALRRFISSWYLSYMNAEEMRGNPEAGPQEHLTMKGDNLPNVIQYLKEQHLKQLNKIMNLLVQKVPRLEKVDAEMLRDGRLLLQIKDIPFDNPILARFTSDGTLKLLAYLTLLNDPRPPQVIGIEEPENQIHPKLLLDLVEECKKATATSQLFVTTHSPYFVNGLKPKELWVLYRNEKGFTTAKRAFDMDGIKEHVESGAQLGHLWLEGYFDVGDPLDNAGGPRNPTQTGLFDFQE
ncbi:MAG: AAA family ATPase [Candidatus Thermoplasmatota archaeon]|nr:AAA family ATPase [Euryarchaeota archaeon]MBU4144044.1 AAA family ATPase [Candidatus Thermoplasmatota archaeon]MBU4591842.1 AAA family ATPase [Candidatus Thermoplasmatota archaeon]